MRQFAGIIFSVIGFFLSILSLNSLSSGSAMSGPMAINWASLLPILLFPLGSALVYSGTQLMRINPGRPVLILAAAALILAMKHTWQYPPVDGAWYLLRYGQEHGEEILAPDAWQHVVAYAYSCLLLYFGTIRLFFQERSLPVARNEQVFLLLAVPAIACVALIYTAIVLYDVFIETLVSGAPSSMQRQTHLAVIATPPVGLTVLSVVWRAHFRLAVACLLSGAGFGLLLAVTYLTYRVC